MEAWPIPGPGERVAVGLSGGVDSSVAALLLRDRGCQVIGVTMTLGRAGEASALADVRAAAERLGVPLAVFDLSADWRREVVETLRTGYLAGRTPNPCIRCNEIVKFGLLPRRALAETGSTWFATGHYARLGCGEDGGPALMRAVDRAKDQSYFLYRVSRDVLSRTVFPLGAMTKAEVRSFARTRGLEVAEKGDSQDFCGGDVKAMVGAAPSEGNVVTREGKVLGRHPGYWNYTVGMRRGLGIGGGTPYYVIGIDAARNEVVVGFRGAAVRHDLALESCVGVIDRSLPVKVRSAGEPRLLSEGVLGAAPGQSAVFYRDDVLVGGGIIADERGEGMALTA